MKKILLIIIFATGFVNIESQNNKPDEGVLLTKDSPVEVLTWIKLDSELEFPPLYYMNRVYTQQKSGLISSYDSTGKIVWKNQLSPEVHSKSVIVDDQFISGTTAGELVSILTTTGKQVQSIGIEDSLCTDLTVFDYKGEKELFMPKQTGSKAAILFGTAGGKTFCLDLETLQEYWRNNDFRSSSNSLPVVVENKILISGSDGYIYSIDARNGLLNWRWKETAETDFSESQIICDGKKVFVVSKESQLFCLDLLLGKLIWKEDENKFFPLITMSKNRKELYTRAAGNKFLTVSADKGTIRKEVRLESNFDGMNFPVLESDDKIYLAGNNSIVSIDKTLTEEIVLKFSEKTILSFQLIGNKKFLVSTTTGDILIFRPRK